MAGSPELDLAAAAWRKSSYTANAGNCVEVADGYPGVMPVRDSKDPEGPVLVFGAPLWLTFVEGVKRGSFAG
ncbi:DUF397 domain-containing protein [Streptomyces sp. NBC_01456]|uniref:DUF397 domain-containing protein n=1 Tax=Streptomyces sp. NBC_01456 TaxID=2975868 RepID=UPI002E375F4B|nr:DUF397 domain-containing protein [Streptomyces sp. NBC_01456]